MSKRNKQKDRQAAAKPVPAGGMAVAAAWPLYEVLLSRQWDTPGGLVTMLVARQAPDSGKLAAAFFVVDLACLGVKRVHAKRFAGEEADGNFDFMIAPGPPGFLGSRMRGPGPLVRQDPTEILVLRAAASP